MYYISFYLRLNEELHQISDKRRVGKTPLPSPSPYAGSILFQLEQPHIQKLAGSLKKINNYKKRRANMQKYVNFTV